MSDTGSWGTTEEYVRPAAALMEPSVVATAVADKKLLL